MYTNIPAKKNSRLKIHCFLINASRLKILENSNQTQITNSQNSNSHTTNHGNSNGNNNKVTNSLENSNKKPPIENMKIISEESLVEMTRLKKSKKLLLKEKLRTQKESELDEEENRPNEIEINDFSPQDDTMKPCLPKSLSNNSLTWRIIEKKKNLNSNSFAFNELDDA